MEVDIWHDHEPYPHELTVTLFQVIDKSFGFDTAVEEAQRAINAAHVEAVSAENGIGLVKLMGRHSGKLLWETNMLC
jgi:6-phosphofructokinase